MSSNKQTYKGKKWCEYCRTQINWTKEDIAYHEQSRTHKKNVEREIEFKRQKIIREQEQAKKMTELDDSAKLMQEIEKKAQEAMQNNTSQRKQQKMQFDNQAHSKNPSIGPVFPVFQLEKEPELTEEQKKELKKQKKKEELGSEFGSSYEESDTDEEQDKYREEEIELKMNQNKAELAQKFDRVWYLSKDEKTGKLFFYNQLSGQRKYEKPIGLKLLDEEQRLWDEYILQQMEEQEKLEQAEQEATNKQIREYKNKNLKEGENDSQSGQQEQKVEDQINDQEGIIKSDWVEVTEEDNFFNKYAVRNVYGDVLNDNGNNEGNEEEEEEDDGMDDDEVKKLAKIELLIEQGKIQTQQEMIQALLQTNEGGNTMKQNEKLKKIIESNLDIQNDTMQKTYKKKNWLEDEDSTNVNQQKPVNNNQKQDQKQADADQKSQTKSSLFKKRINNNKNVQNIPVDN
ncbi:hypothetical protein TTHERM_00446500 (macronuclear) [Tetrahymena thermophila SB210]|uniref:U1 zinc finger protein n=1 Tax=Tetrahymena thermophila (strain SB210) TaxID=312017 RepID=I7MLW0_TETTS|nr:hypothetical protein TTHERM_00446500 [Tetrahymena thermophila SB210]EAS03168.2 hypothetical protein TTHERM_00446500 [Tetrahymena thermophila SB210]|eukprot:XP_001023413.2 hypothetical protein TTHERM_00446500 [Tetrahymena thermophila SB210]